MDFTSPQFTKGQIDRAGRALLDPDSGQQFDHALEIINNWRSSHAYPLNTFTVTLRNKAGQVQQDALVAQRIKRLSSIALKLERFQTMTLSQMQDLGGCRAIVRSVPRVAALRRLYAVSRFEHALHTEDDYIDLPKTTGYRGIHLIYQYQNERKPQYKRMKIEIQLRTTLQHAWATAVETVGTFTRQALKSSQGQDTWLRFFALMGTAVSRLERTTPVPGTPGNQRVLVRELRDLARELDVVNRLNTYGEALQTITQPGARAQAARYFLLELDPSQNKTTITGYRSNQLEKAEDDYLKLESQREKGSQRDAVLVSVQSLTSLQTAYPNYFLDTKLFVGAVNRALSSRQ